MGCLQKAGIGPKDVDVIQLQDTDAGAEVIHLAENGFCADGEQEALSRPGLEIGGRLPVNTTVGCSRTASRSVPPVCQIHEVVLQLRGQAGDRQAGQAQSGLHATLRRARRRGYRSCECGDGVLSGVRILEVAELPSFRLPGASPIWVKRLKIEHVTLAMPCVALLLPGWLSFRGRTRALGARTGAKNWSRSDAAGRTRNLYKLAATSDVFTATSFPASGPAQDRRRSDPQCEPENHLRAGTGRGRGPALTGPYDRWRSGRAPASPWAPSDPSTT